MMESREEKSNHATDFSEYVYQEKRGTFDCFI